MSKITDFLT